MPYQFKWSIGGMRINYEKSALPLVISINFGKNNKK